MPNPPRIVIATGGTGGHFYPAVALGHELAKSGCELLYGIRVNDSTAKRLRVEKFKYVEVPCAPFFGQSPLGVVRGVIMNLLGFFKCIRILKEFRADALVAFGAYVSVPLATAAGFLGIPVILHEQNVVPGWANRFCAVFARRVAVSFAEAEAYFPKKAFLVGNLVREEISLGRREEALAALGLSLKLGLKTFFVFGGSAGAKSVNRGVIGALDDCAGMKGAVQFLHLSGSTEESEMLRAEYARKGFAAVVLDYSDAMKDCYAAADLAICRSGATTLSELAITRVPAVLIPFPHAISDHQAKNAEVLVRLGAAVMIRESANLADDLGRALKGLAADGSELAAMREAYGRFPVDLKQAPGKLAAAVLESARHG